MPLNTIRRPNRYRSSRRGLSGGRGGSDIGRSPLVLPLPAGGGNSGVVPTPQPGPPPGTLLPLPGVTPPVTPPANQTGWQTVPTIPGASTPTAQIPMPPFPGAVFAGSNTDFSVVFWEDPASGQIRTFNGGQELNSRSAAVLPPTPAPAPAAPAPAAPAPASGGMTLPGGVNIPASQFAGGVIPPWLQAALNGQAVAMADGGVIPEPVIGIGQISGRRYSFGERGPEKVEPAKKPYTATGDGRYAEGGTIGYAPSDQGLSGFGQNGMLRLSPNDPDAPGLMAKYPGRYEYTSPAAAAPYLQQLANEGNSIGSMPQGYATPVAQPGSPAFGAPRQMSMTPPQIGPAPAPAPTYTQNPDGTWTGPIAGIRYAQDPNNTVQPQQPIGGMGSTPPPPSAPTPMPQQPSMSTLPDGSTLVQTGRGVFVTLPDGRTITYEQWIAMQPPSTKPTPPPPSFSPAPFAQPSS